MDTVTSPARLESGGGRGKMSEHEDLSFTLRSPFSFLNILVASAPEGQRQTDPQGLLTGQPHLVSKPPVLVRDLALEGSREGSPGDNS